MIEALHLPHTLIVSSPYTYIMQFSTSYCGYRSSGCPCLIFTLYDLRVDVVGAEGGLSVGTYDKDPSSPSYSHRVFSIHIYNAIQHQLLWLQVIRMPLPDIYSL